MLGSGARSRFLELPWKAAVGEERGNATADDSLASFPPSLPSVNKHSLHTYHVPRPVAGSGDTYVTLSLWFRSRSIQGNKQVTDQLKYIVNGGCEERHHPPVQEISETRVSEPVRIAEMRFWVNSSRKQVSPLSGDHAMRRSRMGLLKRHPPQKDYPLPVVVSKRNIKSHPRGLEFHPLQEKSEERAEISNTSH